MPWSETCRMEERARFVLEAEEGWSSMVELCERYGISRRVGYKWVERYRSEGLSGLNDRTSRRHTQARETPPELRAEIIELRKRHPTWGPKKLKAWLERRRPGVPWPAPSTMGEILRREGLSKRRRRRNRVDGAWRAPRTEADEANRVWTADFKGEFQLGCGRLCYPLTVVDAHSRFVLECRRLPSTATAGAKATFERVFRRYGLPEVIRTDNGIPFSSHAVAGLSKLSVWWIRLGIRLERTRRGRPQDNGAHERMHRTLKAEATRPARRTPEQQQRTFNRFMKVYNEERPHEALGLETPASRYDRSERRMPRRLPSIAYPETFLPRRINRKGQVRVHGSRYFLSETLAGQTVGLNYRDDGDWDLFFGPAHLAVIDTQQGILYPRRARPKR